MNLIPMSQVYGLIIWGSVMTKVSKIEAIKLIKKEIKSEIRRIKRDFCEDEQILFYSFRPVGNVEIYVYEIPGYIKVETADINYIAHHLFLDCAFEIEDDTCPSCASAAMMTAEQVAT